MPTFVTTCTSLTGNILYSDCFVVLPEVESDTPIKGDVPFLNQWAGIPFIGDLAGVTRCALAVIHIIGHLFASIIFWNNDHLFHVMKGSTELLRGFIEMMPICGRIFVWLHDAPHFHRFVSMPWAQPVEFHSFFIIKIYNPDQPDMLDRMEELYGEGAAIPPNKPHVVEYFKSIKQGILLDFSVRN